MAIRIQISFKESVDDIEVYDYLKRKSSVMGTSAYIKMLIQKEMEKDKNADR